MPPFVSSNVRGRFCLLLKTYNSAINETWETGSVGCIMWYIGFQVRKSCAGPSQHISLAYFGKKGYLQGVSKVVSQSRSIPYSYPSNCTSFKVSQNSTTTRTQASNMPPSPLSNIPNLVPDPLIHTLLLPLPTPQNKPRHSNPVPLRPAIAIMPVNLNAVRHVEAPLAA